jgi:uncharacterized protein (DUF1697 family)
MTCWIALLRGINVGRNKRLAMADLRDLLDGLGYTDVRTILNSGNAVFVTSENAAATIERRVVEAIDKVTGLDVKVVVRSSTEFASVIDGNPFTGRVDDKELHVAFLSAAFPAAKARSLNAGDFAPDDFEIGDRAIYLRLPNGVTGSKLPDWEKLLGLTVTARNWNTVTKIASAAVGG